MKIVPISKFTRRLPVLRRKIMQARTAEEAMQGLAAADAIEEAMCEAGYRKNTEVIRPANELRFVARWRLGQLLAKVERDTGPGRGKKVSRLGTSFRSYLRDVGLNKNRANECERIGAIPAEANVNGWGPLNPRAPQSTSGRRTIKELPVWETGSVELG